MPKTKVRASAASVKTNPVQSTRSSPRKGASGIKRTAGTKRKRAKIEPDEDADGEEGNEEVGAEDDAYEEVDDDEPEYNSDALDDEDDTARTKAKDSLKKKRSGAGAGTTSSYFESDEPKSKAKSPTKGTKKGSKSGTPKKVGGRKKRKVDEDGEGEAEEMGGDEEFQLEDGQEVVGRVVQAPTTGRVAPGQISQNTLNFLTKLKDPNCNDREWFKLHEPVYRLAEKEWKDFIEAFTDHLVEVDSQVPPLPPKDVIHRIYRDVRFSNDKTPYKKGFSASFSRSGRKGIFAGYHVAVKPGGESIVAAGTWCPGRNELATIRANLLESSTRLRSTISAPAFVKYFGEPKPRTDGVRRNIFGAEDELKVAPKGVDKEHEDIDLLKCRSFAVVHRFSDEVVLDPDFKERLAEVVGVMRPFVHCLNDLMTVGNGGAGGTAADRNDSGNGNGGARSGRNGNRANGTGRGRAESGGEADEEDEGDDDAE